MTWPGACGLALLAALLLACGESEPGTHSPATRSVPEATSRHGSAQSRLQNLVLITLDTTRADALNPYGQERVTSPNLDRVAREGVLFEQVASASPSTLPSHATILTGLYPLGHGVRSNAGYRLPGEALTLAEILQARGYRTRAEIASTVLDASRGLDQGFERYQDLRSHAVERIEAQGGSGTVALDERPAGDVTHFGKRFLDANRAERFFLWLHYFDPHLVYVNRPDFARQIPDDGYLAEVLYTDHQLGAFLAHLELLGLRDRTLVVVVADHGEGRGEHGESTHAYFVYESTIRVPLLLWGPRDLPAGKRVRALVRTADILPTALDLLDVPIPAGLDGQSLRPLIESDARDALLSAYAESIELASVFDGAPLRSLRRGPWKYIHQLEPALHHLGDDPNELVNLADQQPERLAALRAELESLVRAARPAGDASARIEPAERERLAALGYVVGHETVGTELLGSLELFGPSPASMAGDVEKLARALGSQRVGKLRAGLSVVEELVARHPDSAYLHTTHGELLAALGRPEAARAAYERAVASADCGARARVPLANLLHELGLQEARHEVLATGIERCASSPELLNNYAQALATSPIHSLRDGERALRLAQRARAAHGSDQPEVLDTLAAAQAELGDFEAAASTLERALALARRLERPPALRSLLEANLAKVRAGEPLREGSVRATGSSRAD